MSLNKLVKADEGFLIPEDTYIAKLYSVVDVGVQESTYEGKVKFLEKVALTFELQGMDMSDGRPAAITGFYTISANKKGKLRPVLDALIGAKAIDDAVDSGDSIGTLLENALGKAVMISVIHNQNNDRTYANIQSVTPLPKAMQKEVTALANNKILILDADTATKAELESIPEFLRNKMAKRVTASGNNAEGSAF